MDGLTRFGLRKSSLTIFLMISLLLIGLQTYIQLPKREDPAVVIRAAVVAAQFPGMAPERVEDLIAEPLERAAREIAEVEDIKTRITTGEALLTLDLFASTSAQELPEVFQNIRNKMSEAAGQLPEGTQGPFVNTDYGDVAIATVAVTGDGYSYAELWDSAEALQAGIYQLDGISKVTIQGRQEERIWLEVDSRRLASVGAQIEQVLNDLRAQNVILPAGQIDANGTTILLEANGDLETVDEVRAVLTKAGDLAGFVRLEDLMTVRRGYVDPPVDPIYFDGEPALMLSVEMAEGTDIQRIGASLRDRIADLEGTQPIGIQYRLSTFQETNVTQAVNGALSNVGQTFGVVVLVIMLFLGLRPALVIASIVPFTVAFALISMSRFGVDLEQVSIAAVIVSLGLLVDNGLVVVEDIQERISGGTDPAEAAQQSGGQFFIPLGVASLTTVAAFLPMLILEGSEGEYALSLGGVVAMMLLGSWLVAHYMLPFIASRFLKPSRKAKKTDDSRLLRWYESVVRVSLRRSLLCIIGCYALVVVAAGAFGSLKAEMFPLSERKEFLVYFDMPKGTSISETRDQALAFGEWLRDPEVNPEVRDTTTYVGTGGPRFYLSLNPADNDPASAFILVNTHSFEGAVAAADRARDYLYENVPEAQARVTRLSMGGAESGVVKIEITGPDADVLLTAASQVQGAFDQVPQLVQNQHDWGNKVPKIVADIAQDKARELGVTSQQISEIMDAYFSGASWSVFRSGSDQIPISVRASETFRDSVEDLGNLTVPSQGRFISLDQVATLVPQLEYSVIRRENEVRQITISGKSGTLSAAEVEAIIAPTLAELDLGPEYIVKVGGESADSAKTYAKLGAGLPVAFVVMLGALIFQFNSFRRTALTLMTIPLIAIGAPLALLVTGLPLSFFAVLGMISLMGIIINNAIVMIDQIDIERETLPYDEAILTGARKRMKPVMLTSLTTVLGLLPLALSGGALFEPMATLMIGGLLLASPLTLIFVPAAYRLLVKADAPA